LAQLRAVSGTDIFVVKDKQPRTLPILELSIRFRDQTIWGEEYCYGTDLIYTVLYYLVLLSTVGWPTTSALAAGPTICI
jgi:hypothetical protein